MGPLTEPWGTLQVRGIGFDLQPFMHTIWEWKDRYDLNHSSAWPWTPRDASSFNRISWSTVSNAEDRSNNTMAVIFPTSISCNMKLDTYERRVSTLWFEQYEDCWWWSYKWLSIRYWDSLEKTILSRTLNRKGRFDTRQYLERFSGSRDSVALFLGIPQ